MKRLICYYLLTKKQEQSDLPDLELEAHKNALLASGYFGAEVETILPLDEVPVLFRTGEQWTETIVEAIEVPAVMGPDPEWTIPEPEIDPETEEPIPWEEEPAAPIIVLEPAYTIPAVTREMMTFPAEFVLIEQDMTAELELQAKLVRRVKLEQFGKDFKRWIQIRNEEAGITPAQVIALRSDARLKLANELAEGGDIASLLYHVEETNWAGLFDSATKAEAIARISAALGSL